MINLFENMEKDWEVNKEALEKKKTITTEPDGIVSELINIADDGDGMTDGEREEKRLTWKKEDSNSTETEKKEEKAAPIPTPTAEEAFGTPPAPLSDDEDDDLPF